MPTSLVLTVIGPDRPGIVNLVSDCVTQHGGNWLQSRMANLGGQFAGIVLLQVPEAKVDTLLASLRQLEAGGLQIAAARAGAVTVVAPSRRLLMELVGHDRPGVVQQISRELALRGVSIEELATDCVSGSMSGESLLRARALLSAPVSLATASLRDALESIASDLMVDLTLDESAAGP